MEREREPVDSLGGTVGFSSLLGRSEVSYSPSSLGTESFLPDSGSDLAFRRLLQGYSFHLFIQQVTVEFLLCARLPACRGRSPCPMELTVEAERAERPGKQDPLKQRGVKRCAPRAPEGHSQQGSSWTLIAPCKHCFGSLQRPSLRVSIFES